MSEPESFTAAQASDPQTPGQVLADIAALRPDLRPAVAANPSAYAGLLEWLGSLGEPAVDAAIAARLPAGGASQQPQYQQPPVRPATAPATALPPQGQYAPSGAAAYGQAPPGGYGYGPGAPPAKKSHTVLWIVLGVVGLLIVLAVVAVLVIFNRVRDEIAEFGDYGSNERFDQLWDRCADEDWAACDELFNDSPIGSEYEDFGDTCGNRQAGGTGVYCVESFGGGDASTQDDSGGEPNAYGDDPYFDGLWDACEGGDMQACDDLFMESPFDSEYETFGDTCGNRQVGGTGVYCVDSLGGDSSSQGDTGGEPNAYGDDPYLDGLWDACAGGDMQACDDLFMESPFDSEYETFGDTCGGRTDGSTFCAP
jgi:hypothetical protein